MKKMKLKTRLAAIIIVAILLTVTFYSKSLILNTKITGYKETKQAGSYNEVYSLIKKINYKNKLNEYDLLFGFLPVKKGRSKMSDLIGGDYDNTTNTNEAAQKDYSDTNLQVLGVQEADIIKTDGDYIYALSTEYLYIVKTTNGDMSIISKIKHVEEHIAANEEINNSHFFEIYITDNRLIALQGISSHKPNDDIAAPRDMMPDQMFYPRSSNNNVGVVIFDITDKNNPQKINELTQSGSYVSSRMIDNYLYIITNYYVYNEKLNKDDIESYVPAITNGEVNPIDPKDIYIVPNPESNQYITVSGINVNNTSQNISTKAIFGCGNNVYANAENLFIASDDSVTEGKNVKSKTNLLKFSINQGKVELKATGSVYGNILNQFSMDETNNYFRIVTTSRDYTTDNNVDLDTSSISNIDDSKNNLYVLDNDLKIIGKIEDIAKGESVHSVRFDGNYAYFVTFRQVDPLFTVDISDPANPKILSSLKIPGFSEYLHIYNNDLLFGLGKNADLEGRVLGMKLSMFDISDKANVTEKYKILLEDKYTWSIASYNHKAIMVSSAKGLIGFPTNNSYLIYKFDNEKGFIKLHETILNDENYFYNNMRGLYIENYFYIYDGRSIKSFDMGTFTLAKDLLLDK